MSQSKKVIYFWRHLFLLGYWILWYIVFHSILAWFFVFLWCVCNFSFISDFVYESLFSFFLRESSQGLVNFINLFKEPAPYFIYFLCSLFSSISFNSALIFFYLHPCTFVFIVFREWERGGERERGRETLIDCLLASCIYGPGIKPAT